MLKRCILVCSAFLCGLSLSGCTVVDNVDGRVESVNRNINEARNQSILLNIARASLGHPLNFVSIGSVGGSTSLGGGLGLPSLTFGPQKTVAQRQYTFGGNSLSSSASANFNINPLESKEFYNGLLAPLDMRTAHFFIAQGFPREIVFYLFIDSLTIRNSSGTIHLANDLDSPTFDRFTDYMRRTVDYGVSLEPFGGDGKVRLCFDAGRALKPLGQLEPVCGSRKAGNGIRNFVEGAHGAVDVELKIRSTYQIFQYLGRLSADGDGAGVTLVSPDLVRQVAVPRPSLFPVGHDRKASCLTSLTYAGRYFCVPMDRGATSGRVMELLTILVALSSSVRDLPAIQTIQVTQ